MNIALDIYDALNPIILANKQLADTAEELQKTKQSNEVRINQLTEELRVTKTELINLKNTPTIAPKGENK